MTADLFGNVAADDPETFEAQYAAYIKSVKWRQKREQVLHRAGYKCERCGLSKWSGKLEVHHLTYEHFMSEPLEDLMVVCEKCHKLEDDKRAQQTAIRQEYKLNEARLNGWASKVYGENWWMRGDLEYIEDQFNEWLERKENKERYGW